MDVAYTRQQHHHHHQQRPSRQQQSQQSLRQQRIHQGQQRHNSTGNNSHTFLSASSPVNNISNIIQVSSPVKSATSSPVKVIKDTKISQSNKCIYCLTSSLSSSNGLKETFISLALLCFVSLFTAFLSLIFLQKTCTISSASIYSSISSEANNHQSSSSLNDVTSTRVSSVQDKEYIKVTQICVSLSSITVSLNLCSVFVSCIQFLSAAKLLKTPQGTTR